MDKEFKKFIPMSETMLYMLYSFRTEKHGYAVMKHVRKMTNDRIQLGAGTVYQTIKKLEKGKLIRFTCEEERQKKYVITAIGLEVLKLEIKRIEEIYTNMRGGL